MFFYPVLGFGQGLELRREHDSLYWLNDWRLPYPVYRFERGDVNGDGCEDAVVGVVKSTRYYREQARRIFIFKQVNGKARPLWLGSKLGGVLEDFRFADGRIRALEGSGNGLYSISDYRWGGFGLVFERFIIKNVKKEKADEVFKQ